MKSIATIVVTCLSGLASIAPCSAQASDVAAVVNVANPVGSVSAGQLRKIFAGDQRSWPNGHPVRLIVRAPGSHERQALLKLLHMSETQYKDHWSEKVFHGEADSEPVLVLSVGMQMEALRVYPDAITLVDVHDIKPMMKVLRVDGRFPGEIGYPVH